MTIIASLLFLAALIGSAFVVILTMKEAMPRIQQVVELEFGPQIKIEHRITFGPVRYQAAGQPADVVAFPMVARVAQNVRLAA